MPGPWGVELSLHHLSLAQTWLFLQEGVDQSAQPGNIFTSVQSWMQWERGGGEAVF